MSLWRISLAAALVGAPLPAIAQAPAMPTAGDTIRGSVRSEAGELVPGARIYVTDVESRRTEIALTDSLARFAVWFENGAGTYVVVVNAPAYTVWRKRVARETSHTLVVEVTLAPPPVLQTVRVEAQRRNTVRRGTAVPDLGGAAASVRGDQLPDPTGNFLLGAATVPGVHVIDAGTFSVLGLSAAQNRVTLNGMSLGFVELPRDASASGRVLSSSSDASRGGFGGAELAIVSHPAQTWTRRILRASAEHPSLSGADPLSRWSGGAERDIQVNGTIDGPLSARFQQSTSVQIGERRSDPVSLLRSAPAGASVIPSNIAQAFAARASALGLPTDSDDDGRRTRSASLLSRLDAPRQQGMSFDLTLAASVSDSRGVNVATNALPSAGGSNSQLGATIQLGGSQSLWGIARHEPRVGLSIGRAESRFASLLPRAAVRLDDESMSLVAGGAGTPPSRTHSIAWQGRDQLSWFTADNEHRFTVTAEGEWQQLRLRATPPSSGTFTFASIDDFAANRPSSFGRSGQREERVGQAGSGSLAIGDVWRLSARRQLQLGVRADLAVLRLDQGGSAEAVDLSPRLGFTQMIGQRGPNGVQGARATVRASAGRYVNRWSTMTIASSLTRGGAARLECVGDEVPTPQWSAWAAGSPVQLDGCEGELAPPSLLPDALVLSEAVRPEASWRGTVSLSMPVSRFLLVAEGIWSRSERLSYLDDLNLRGIAELHLPGETGRPVYASLDAVDSRTGIVPQHSSRAGGAGSRWRLSSGLAGTSRQLSLSVAPERPTGATRWSLAYVLGDARREYAGIDAATMGDPRARHTAASDLDIRHRVVGTARTRLANAVDLMLFANVRSGLPFTPLVSTDINGDGAVNDAAFVFGGADPAIANAMARVASTDGGRCLRAQRERIAGINSCRGPWTTTVDASMTTLPGVRGIPRRMSLSLGAINLAAGADALLHGAGTRGWGQGYLPDPFLLHVVGFDQNARSYRYVVNPRFGSAATTRMQRPFRLVLTARMEVGPDPLAEQMKAVLRPGRTGSGTPGTAEQIRRTYEQNAPDQIGSIIALRDSVMLSAAQETALTEIRQWRESQVSPIWASLAEYLATLPANYDVDEATRRVQRAQYDAYGVMIEVAKRVGAVLGADQMRMLPGSARVYLDPSQISFMRRVYRP